MGKVTEVEGIGPANAAKLEEAGITTTEGLLEAGASPQGRQGLAEKTGLGAGQILKWVNMVDLFRVKGIGEEYSELLEAAGVDTVPELAQRNAQNLHQKLLEVNEEKSLVRRTPTEAEVSAWVDNAKELPRAVTY